MLAHEFAHELLRGALAEFVVMLDRDFQDAVAVDLPDLGNAAAGYVLAHQHAQRRRLERADLLLLRQLRARAIRAGGEQEQMILAAVSNGQVQFVALRLHNAVDSAADERISKLARKQGERKTVQGHSDFLRY